MENISQDQFLALGAVGLAIFAIAFLVSFLIMAVTMKLSIKWIGNSSPSIIACFGWLLAMTFVNGFIMFASGAVLGQMGGLLALPLTLFATLYMYSMAAECDLLRAFGIWTVNSLLSSIGLIAVAFVAAIPLAMIGAGAQAGGEGMQADFQEVEKMMADLDAQMKEIDAMEFPEPTNVSFEVGDEYELQEGDEYEFQEGDGDTDFQLNGPSGEVSTAEVMPPTTEAPKSSVQSTGTESASELTAQPKSRPSRQKPAPRRAPDGSTINPFFQD